MCKCVCIQIYTSNRECYVRGTGQLKAFMNISRVQGANPAAFLGSDIVIIVITIILIIIIVNTIILIIIIVITTILIIIIVNIITRLWPTVDRLNKVWVAGTFVGFLNNLYHVSGNQFGRHASRK